MPPIVAIQFQPTGRSYHFDSRGIDDLEPGDRVVVETSRGRQLGIVTGYVPEKELEGRSCKPIERRATPRDLLRQEQWQAKAPSALLACREQVEQLGLKGYKFIKAEYNYDGTQVTILYTTDKKRSELGELERNLRRSLRTRVELYQIGPRDLAKELDGLGACGIQRCCSRFLTRFNSVSIRMAKTQQISLAPSEITGVCGRLRCCLAYEHEQYVEAAEGLPKRNKQIVTPHGKGRVVEIRTLAGTVVVDVEGVRHTVDREDIGKTEFTHPPVEAPVAWPEWVPAAPESAPAKEEDSGRKKSSSRRSRRRSRPRKPKSDSEPGAASPNQARSDSAPKKRRSSRRRRPNKNTNQGKKE